MNRGELVTAVADRTGTGDGDPFRPRIPARVNEALHEFDDSIGTYWPWAVRAGVALTVAAADDRVSLANDIQPIVADNIGVPTAQQFPLKRVLQVEIVTSAGRASLDEVSPRDRGLIGAGWASPYAWAVDGPDLFISPAPAAALTLQFRVILGERDLPDDSAVPLAPARYHYAVVQLGRSFVYEQRGDDERAVSARARYDALIKQVRSSSRSSRGGRRPMDGS